MNNTSKYKRLSQTERVEVVSSYLLDKSNTNIDLLCKKYNITKQTIYNLAKKKDIKLQAMESINETAPNFSKRVDFLIEKALDKLEYKLNEEDTEKATYRDLAVLIGTLYDKSRLDKNLSTENKAIEINIKVEH